MLAGSDASHKESLIPLPQSKRELLPTSVLYGANASGKSSILMALQLMQAMVAGEHAQPLKDKPLPFYPFAFVEDNVPAPTEFAVQYFYNGVKYAYGYTYNASEIISEYLYHWPNGRQALIFERDKIEGFKCADNKNEQNTLVNRTPSNRLYLVSSNEWNLPQTEQAYRWFVDKLTKNDAQNTPDETALVFKRSKNDELRRRVLTELLTADLGIADIGVSNASADLDAIIISVVHKIGSGEKYNLPFHIESNGTQRFFSRIGPWIAALQEGSVLLIDEMENNLHPLLTKRLVEMIQDPNINTKHTQLIFTTHDMQFLDLKLLRRDQIWFTEKDEKTLSSSLYMLSEYNVRKDENVQKGYLQGRYGAVPFFGGRSCAGL
jgi:predicted ATP-dependent endonuclease of OLD family